MKEIFLVGVGGFCGALSRFYIGKYVNKYWQGSYPLATFIVNALGSFLLGLLVFHFLQPSKNNLNLFLGVGFLGSFTTFSTFQYENLQLLEKGNIITAALYTLSSFIIGIALAWLTYII